MSFERGRAAFEERIYKKTRKKELCSLLDEVASALYFAYESGIGFGYEELSLKVDREIERLKCKRKR